MPVYELKPSRLLRVARLLLHALAAAALLLADLAAGLQIAGAAVLAAGAWAALRPGPALRLRCREDGSLAVDTGTGTAAASLLPGAVVLPWLCVLRLRLEDGRPLTLVALPDSLPAEEFRGLRVWLQWRAKDAGPAPK